MSTQSAKRPGPAPFVVGGAVLVGVLGLAVDLALSGAGSVDGPLADVTTYNFTLLGAFAGAVLGGFVGFGLV